MFSRPTVPVTDRIPGSQRFWSTPLPELLLQLRSTPQGLSAREAQERLAVYGLNAHHAYADITWPRLLLNQFKNPLVLLLIFAMLLSMGLGEITDALIVLGVVLMSASLGFLQEYRATHTVAKLLNLIHINTGVLRDGTAMEIPAEQVVPGDVILLSAGDAIPADSVLLEAKDLFVDEAALTGESYPAEKNPQPAPADAPLGRRTNVVFQGTHVISGMARALAVRTGTQSEFGQLSQHVRARPVETDFERGIRAFGNMLIYITLMLILSIFAINVYFHKPVVDSFLFALALAVGLTPELLPAIVSITLAQGAQRMAQKQVVVKRLTAIENLGSINVLCSDKTGTLTQGLVQIHAALDAAGQVSEAVLFDFYLNAVFETGFVNPIDQALRNLPQFEARRAGYAKFDEVPYDFIRKRLSVVVAHEGRHTMITKGALRNVLDVCSKIERNGCVQPLGDSRAKIEAQYERFSLDGFRVLGVATRDVTGDPVIDRTDETDMIFQGYLLFEDPLKSGIVEAVADLRTLGIRLKIITGDNRHIATSIGAHVGMTNPDLVTGEDLTRMTDAALRTRAAHVDIFAEIEPNQKERILTALHKAGYVVGYLGDGINDAAALHAADVGISVESAVDVAKEAADIVLLERDLQVLAQGVRIGRTTFANTLKYMLITISANFGNMISMAGASIFLPFLPLLPKQILLNNLLSDLPAMTIATDAADPELVAQPRSWDIRLIRNFMLVFGLVSSIFDYLTFGALLFVMRASETQFQTSWFIESLMTELLIILIIRTRRSVLKSRPRWMLGIAIMAVAVVALVLPYTALGAMFGFVPLPLAFVLLLLAITIFYLIASELTKQWFYRRFDPKPA